MANPRHVSLVANTVLPLTLDRDFAQVELVNVDGAAAVYFTVDGSAPELGVDGSQVLTAGIGAYVVAKVPTSGLTVVRLKADAAVKVCVRGID